MGQAGAAAAPGEATSQLLHRNLPSNLVLACVVLPQGHPSEDILSEEPDMLC